MNFKNVSFLLIFITMFNKVASKKSFTILIDTTQSMTEEVDVIKTKLGDVFLSLNNTSDVANYILLYFNDPDVGPPQYFSSAIDLLAAIDMLKVAGGTDCPEDSLAGIQKALEVSHPESYIFLFTDAYAKSVSNLAKIQNMCRFSRSQVVIFLTGRCIPTPKSESSVNVFYEIARFCSGTVLRLESYHLDQGFRFMKEIVGHDWDIVTQDTFAAHKEIIIPKDPHTSTCIVTVSGEHLQIQILGAHNAIPEYEKIVDTINSQVLRFNTKSIGHTIQVRCEGPTTVTQYRKTELPFFYGFTKKHPRILRETSDSPLPGVSNYILLVPQDQIFKINSAELQFVDDGTRQVLVLEKNSNSNTYIANTFFVPDRSFKVIVNGQDTNTHKDFQIATKIITPQKRAGETTWSIPKVEVIELEPTTVDYGKSTTVACKVTGHPRPNILWETDDGTAVTSEDVLLKLSNVYVSYATIHKVVRNTTVKCVARNAKGEVIETIRLFYNRSYTFDVIQSPQDGTFEYGTEATLFCQVNAYPDATVKWFHNGTEIGNNDSNIQIVPDNNALVIKNVGLLETGEYACQVSNEATTRNFSAIIDLSGIEPPEISLPRQEVVLKVGDSYEVECRVKKGKPTPVTTWKKYDDGVFDDSPADVIVDGNRLKFHKLTSKHSGTYRCLADNVFGNDYADLNIVVQYAPEIKDPDEDILTVKEGELVELKCEVNAFPRARVRWELQQDDVITGFDERHKTDDHNAHKFVALWKDSGNYHCVAENSLGRSEKSVKVYVLGRNFRPVGRHHTSTCGIGPIGQAGRLENQNFTSTNMSNMTSHLFGQDASYNYDKTSHTVPPYIETPLVKKHTVKVGSSFILTCNVLYGNPAPETKWEFTAPNSTAVIILRGKSTKRLRVENVSKEHEGSYMCIADNAVGTDSIRVDVKVQN